MYSKNYAIMTQPSLVSLLNEPAFLNKSTRKIIKLLNTSLVSLVDESAFLNKSLKIIILMTPS